MGHPDDDTSLLSIEESLTALGVDSIDILHLHYPEHAESLEPITSAGGAIDTLFKMREEGLCKVVGLAAGNVDVMLPMLKDRDFGILIIHNRFTLVDATGLTGSIRRFAVALSV